MEEQIKRWRTVEQDMNQDVEENEKILVSLRRKLETSEKSLEKKEKQLSVKIKELEEADAKFSKLRDLFEKLQLSEKMLYKEQETLHVEKEALQETLETALETIRLNDVEAAKRKEELVTMRDKLESAEDTLSRVVYSEASLKEQV